MGKNYIKISREDFVRIGWTMLTGAVTSDKGFFVEKDSAAHKAYLAL